MMTAASAPLSLSRDQIQRVLEIEQGVFSHPWTLADFQWLRQDECSLNLGLWKQDLLVAYAIGVVEEQVFHLASLAVDPGHQRMGWGSRLLRIALEQATEKGCRSCRLEVRDSNHAAMCMYRKFGFAADGVRRRFYTNPVEDARLLRRSLPVEPEPQTMVDG